MSESNEALYLNSRCRLPYSYHHGTSRPGRLDSRLITSRVRERECDPLLDDDTDHQQRVLAHEERIQAELVRLNLVTKPHHRHGGRYRKTG